MRKITKKKGRPKKVSEIPDRNFYVVAALKLKPGPHKDKRTKRGRKYRHVIDDE